MVQLVVLPKAARYSVWHVASVPPEPQFPDLLSVLYGRLFWHGEARDLELF
jgi:hypothetical protein